jgi:hypothetical protein
VYDKFEEYKLLAESTQQLSDRRQSATQTYLTLNTAIFAVLAFLIKDAGLQGWWLVLAAVPLFAAGLLICAIWYRILVQYKELIAWRYDQLMEIEQSPTMAQGYQFYMKEWENFYQVKNSTSRFGFSRLEIWLPHVFLALYLLYGSGLLLATMLGYR